MASALIHIAVAKNINKKLMMNEKELLLGTVAPDAGKIGGIKRCITHFTGNYDIDIPNLNLFFDKYNNKISSAYEYGYLIHLFTDELWFSQFLTNYKNGNKIIDKYGNELELDDSSFSKLIYDDYTALDKKVLDYYDLDLSLFYERIDIPTTVIDEVPYKSLYDLVDKMSLIVANDYTNTETILSLENIVQFIEYCSVYVLDQLSLRKLI